MIQMIIQKMNKKRLKEGSEAIGTALSTVFILSLMLVPIGLFIFLMPRITLEQDVQQFATSVRLDGYVSERVFNEFAERMADRGYDPDRLAASNLTGSSEDWLRVYATDLDEIDEVNGLVDGADLIERSANPTPPVVSRGKGKIAIQVVLPANSGVFQRAVSDLDKNSDEVTRAAEMEDLKNTVRYYEIGREIMSEAYAHPGG